MTAAVASPKRRRTWRVLLAVMAAAVVTVVAVALVRRELAARRLAAVIADLDRTDPNWRLDDLERARPAIPDGENSAVVIDAAFAKIGQPPLGLADDLDSLENSLIANVRLTPRQEGDLRNAIAFNDAAVPDALAIADHPRGRHAIAYTPAVFLTVYPHLHRMSRVNANVLVPLGFLAVQDGDVPRALAVFRARLNLGRSLRDEPVPFVQITDAGRFLHRAIDSLERLLGHATLTPDQLAAVRRELADESANDPWPAVIRGRRAVADRALNAMQNGAIRPSLVKLIALGSNYRPTAVERVGVWVNDHIAIETDRAHAAALELCTREAATAALPWPKRLSAAEAFDTEWAAAPELVRWVCGRRPSDVHALVYNRARLNCAVAAVAVEQHRAAHGDWPATLATLGVELPDDPYTGRPLLYKRLADGVVVYSVGGNRRDDGGNTVGGIAGQPNNTDVVFRLWDVPHRNKPPGGNP
ncbi:MAG: hypothetical protein U0746_19890 [Gemmataceae bacterium]